jgi:hypothetical protein
MRSVLNVWVPHTIFIRQRKSSIHMVPYKHPGAKGAAIGDDEVCA